MSRSETEMNALALQKIGPLSDKTAERLIVQGKETVRF